MTISLEKKYEIKRISLEINLALFFSDIGINIYLRSLQLSLSDKRKVVLKVLLNTEREVIQGPQ
jgi:hypothetical protein